jgi:hypothetical protein
MGKDYEGPNDCAGTSKTGLRCRDKEIDGLEFCIRHVPDELLEEAEEITGIRLCRWNGRCPNFSVNGSDPPRCQAHGMRGDARKGAALNVVENKAAVHLAEIMTANGEKLLKPADIDNPYDELMALAAEMKAGKEILRDLVARLYDQGKIRYAHSQAGEQLRVEILLYERALERFATILINISKLKIEDRLAGIRKQTADMLERALDMALEESGVGLEGKAKARDALNRHLRIVA